MCHAHLRGRSYFIAILINMHDNKNENKIRVIPEVRTGREAETLSGELIPECDIIINDETIRFLKQMFCDKEAYIKHITVLKTILRLLQKNLMDMNEDSAEYKNQLPLFTTLSELTGSIQCLYKEQKLGLRQYNF